MTCALRLAPLLLMASWARASSTPPNNVLTRVESTRAQAFGGAATAIGSDPTLIWVNPAAGANAIGTWLTVGGNRGYAGDTAGQVLMNTPVGLGRLTAAALYYDEGEAEAVDTTGVLWRTKIQQDFAVAAGYAAPLTSKVVSGVTLKVIQSRLGGEVTSRAVAGDLGVQVRMNDAVKIGVALANVGTTPTYGVQGVLPPTVARFGAAAGWRLNEGSRPSTLIGVADGEYDTASQTISWRGGVEYQWRSMVAVRLGARWGADREPSILAGGIGIKFGIYRLDYTVRYNTLADMPQTATLTFAFGGVRPLNASALTNEIRTGPSPSALAPPPMEQPAPPAETVPLPDRETSIVLPQESLSASPNADSTAPPAPPRQDGVYDDLNRRLNTIMDQEGKPKTSTAP